MKKTLLVSVLLLPLLIYLKANKFYGTSAFNANVYSNFQSLVPPHFPGGEKAFRWYLSKNLKWPKTAPDDSQGVVIISFFVEKDGRLTGIKVKKSMGSEFDAEALRVIKISPNWIPAMRNNNPIKSQYTVPIKFFTTG